MNEMFKDGKFVGRERVRMVIDHSQDEQPVEVIDSKARAIARQLFEDYMKQHQASLQN